MDAHRSPRSGRTHPPRGAPEADAPDSSADASSVRRRDGPTVFVLDEPVRADLFELWLSSGCRVVTATSEAEALERFDGSVAVALVRNEMPEEAKETVGGLVRTRAPLCRTVVTTTQHVEIMFPQVEYDVCLVEPTTRTELRETVSRLVRRAEYQATLRRYYEYSMRATNLEIRRSRGGLEDDEKYATVTERADALRRRLEKLLASFDEDDLAAVRRSIRPETELGPQSSERNRKRGEKHRPDKCVGCGLEWGIDHGGGLQDGYHRLGAYVWKCAKCGTVQNLPDPSHRRLARR